MLWQLGGLDTDHCYDESAECHAPWADPVFAILDGHYSEASPSGTGRHHLFVIEVDHIPDGVGKDIDYSLGAGGERHGFELYTRAGFWLTFTGRDVQGDLQAISPFTLMRLFNALEAFKPRARKPKTNGHFAQSDHDKALDILAHLPNAGDYDDYPKWVGVIAALHGATGGSEAGRRASAAWSKDGGSRTAQEGVDVLYEYFDRIPPRADLGHLVNEARDHGYEPYPRRGNDHRSRPNGEVEPNGAAIENATRDWPRPGPIVAELKPVPPFDAGTLLPDVLRAWVMDEAERMPCPPEFVAAAAMVALSSIVGARCAIKPKARDPWLIVPNLWGGIVSDPSAKKSPAWAVALRPLDALIARASETHRQALAEYETERVVFDAQKDAIEGRIKEAAKKASKGDPGVIARELRAHGDQAPAEPILRRYRTNDSTVEKLGELLRDNPTGLLVLRDELVGLIANWEREGREGERAFFLEAWNGNQAFDTDRIGRGHISIANLCLAIFGGIQPDKLVIYLEQAAHALGNDGMLQRFQVLVYPDPRPWEWRDRLPDKTARDAAFDVFNKLAEFDPANWGAAPADEMAKFPWFRFGDEAQRVFIEWSEELHRVRMSAEDDPIIRQHLAKYDKLFPALALVLHLVDLAAGSHIGPVSLEAALRAGAWCEFLEAHARRCYGLLKDDGLRGAQALAAKLARNKLEDGFTLRDVRRNQWRSLTTDEAIQAALDWLEDEDWLRSESTGGTGPGSGRRTVSYKINPAIARKGKGEGA